MAPWRPASPLLGFIVERRAIAIRGVVQGVGFRPFVYGLASRFELVGFVKNRAGDVWIEVEGPGPSLDHFLSELATNPPPLARIEKLTWAQQAIQGDCHFRIEASQKRADNDSRSAIFISPDIATCSPTAWRNCSIQAIAVTDILFSTARIAGPG